MPLEYSVFLQFYVLRMLPAGAGCCGTIDAANWRKIRASMPSSKCLRRNSAEELTDSGCGDGTGGGGTGDGVRGYNNIT